MSYHFTPDDSALIPLRVSEKEKWSIERLRATHAALLWKTDPQNLETGHMRPTLRSANEYHRSWGETTFLQYASSK